MQKDQLGLELERTVIFLSLERKVSISIIPNSADNIALCCASPDLQRAFHATKPASALLWQMSVTELLLSALCIFYWLCWKEWECETAINSDVVLHVELPLLLRAKSG